MKEKRRAGFSNTELQQTTFSFYNASQFSMITADQAGGSPQ